MTGTMRLVVLMTEVQCPGKGTVWNSPTNYCSSKFW